MLGAGILGMLVFLLSIPDFVKSQSDERARFWRPFGKAGAGPLARRVKWGLSSLSYVFTWSLFLPSMLLFGGITILSWASGGRALGIDVALAYGGGAGLAFGAAYLLGLRRVIRAELTAVAIQAAKALARQGDLVDSERILGVAAKESAPRYRLAAAIGLRFVGSETAIQHLNKLAQDTQADVRQAAKGSLENIHAVLRGEHRRSVLPLEEMRVPYMELQNKMDLATDSTLRSQILQRSNEMRAKFDDCIYDQFPWRLAFPDLYCMSCLSRAEEVAFHDWVWVRCKHCMDVFGLQSGIKTVVGQIGGVADQELEGGTLMLNLWQPEDRIARAAELDLLEIIADQGLDYDWAVSAVVERMHAYATTDDMRVAVRISGPLELAPNTQKLLSLIRLPSP